MKERLDVILVNQGYAPSREKAKAIIMYRLLESVSEFIKKNSRRYQTGGCLLEKYQRQKLRFRYCFIQREPVAIIAIPERALIVWSSSK